MSIITATIINILKVLVPLIILVVLIVIFLFLSSQDRSVLLSSAQSFTHGDTQRTYRTNNVPDSQVTNIVIGLHGFGDTSRKFAYYTALHNLADTNTLVVYPDAIPPNSNDIKTGWNAGFCCGSGWVTKTDDVGFFIALIGELRQKYGKDTQVLMTGFSNGAFMAQRFAAEHPERVDGIAVSSGTIGTTKQRITPTAPVPILLMHGEKDDRVNFNGGANDSDPDFNWLPFEETKTTWQDINAADVETKVITYPNNAHTWDGWRLFNIWHKKPDASKEALNFFANL